MTLQNQAKVRKEGALTFSATFEKRVPRATCSFLNGHAAIPDLEKLISLPIADSPGMNVYESNGNNADSFDGNLVARNR
jgi:hypothetical protein